MAPETRSKKKAKLSISDIPAVVQEALRFGRKLSSASSAASDFFKKGQPKMRALSQRRNSGKGNNPFIARKGKVGLSTAYYRGKVRAKRRKRKTDVTKEKFMAKGFLQSYEEHGTLVDPNCVHIGHSTHNQKWFPSVIAKALLRAVLSKAGFEVDDQEKVLPLSYDQSGLGWVFVLYGVNESTGAIQECERYNCSATDTLETMSTKLGAASGGPSLVTLLQTIMNGNTYSNLFNWARLDLMFTDSFQTGSFLRLAASLNLNNHKLVIMSKSSIVIQNRSKGATSGDIDSHAVDNQPLKGYMYQFSNGQVATKQVGTLWNKGSLSSTGLIKKVAADFLIAVGNGYISNSWKEPQPPAIFRNVSGSTRLSLQPGDIKKGTITSYYTGYFNDVLGKIRDRSNFPVNNAIFGPVLGKSQLFSMEEVINTGTQNQIVVQYETDKHIGAYVKQINRPVLIQGHAEEAAPI